MKKIGAAFVGAGLAVGAYADIKINDNLSLYGYVTATASNYNEEYTGGGDSDEGLLEVDSMKLQLTGSFEKTTGVVSLVANTIMGAAPGASGSGTLITLHLKGIGGRPAVVTLTDLLLLDSGGNSVAAQIEAAKVNIPEPGYCLLIGVLLIAGGVSRRFRA